MSVLIRDSRSPDRRSVKNPTGWSSSRPNNCRRKVATMPWLILVDRYASPTAVSYRRGGSSECSSHASGRGVQGGVGRLGSGAQACPVSCSCCSAVSVRLAVSRGGGGGRRPVRRCRGRCADPGVPQFFDALTMGLSRLCGVGTCPVRTPWHPSAHASRGAIAQQDGSFVGSWEA